MVVEQWQKAKELSNSWPFMKRNFCEFGMWHSMACERRSDIAQLRLRSSDYRNLSQTDWRWLVGTRQVCGGTRYEVCDSTTRRENP